MMIITLVYGVKLHPRIKIKGNISNTNKLGELEVKLKTIQMV